MNHADILEIADSWSFWTRPVPPSTPRHVLWPDALRPSLALVVQGVRRCGKSTLLHQMMGHYALDPMRCLFINFEDPRLIGHLETPLLDTLQAAFVDRHPDEGPLTFFLDEVQAVHGWERWLRAQLDRPSRCRFVITGSSATLLSGELGTTLTGRHLSITLYPMDLAERQASAPSVDLHQWLVEGGFPEAIQMTDGERLLRQYFLDIVERDIRERVGARSARPVRQVAQMAFESAGSELSLRRIAAAAGVAVETAGSYLEACEQAYLLYAVPYFAWSERKRSHRNRKYYPVDTGLRRAVSTPGGADLGKDLECATHLMLRRRFEDVYYWREAASQLEVDFVVQRGREVIPIQVTWDEPKPRHEAALDAFFSAFPQASEPVFVTAQSYPQLAAAWR